ncbi:hypothetical protein [Streptomyces sp. NPDC053755]|uniref:hypothetical protein n=1 Tax=Streptomyces sp. NPDC053755 TaxID=3155815 RepID=UPI0034273875
MTDEDSDAEGRGDDRPQDPLHSDLPDRFWLWLLVLIVLVLLLIGVAYEGDGSGTSDGYTGWH